VVEAGTDERSEPAKADLSAEASQPAKAEAGEKQG
jgi:hypothetical protein